MVRRRTTPVSSRFQQGVNPYTGLNQRDFPAGLYVDRVVKQLVRESLERVLVPAGYTLDVLEWHYDGRDPADAIVRMTITPPVGPQAVHDVRVVDEGTRPWAGRTGPIVVAWVKETFAL